MPSPRKPGDEPLSEPIIETADELYREMKNRGLHLRKENGRDNALLAELCARLDCPDDQLASFLRSSKMPASEFLHAFLEVAAPFARMFQGIWAFLAAHLAPDARQEIRVRFGLNEETPREVNLEAFREMARTGQTVLGRSRVDLWSFDIMQRLFEIPRILGARYQEGSQPPERYHPGEQYSMRSLPAAKDDFERMVSRIRDLFQAVADEFHKSGNEGRGLPELNLNIVEKGNASRSDLQRRAYLLTDLLPMWNVVFHQIGGFNPEFRRRATDFFEDQIAPFVREDWTTREIPIWKALDVLDLPFWRDRWQTYEVWANVTVLGILEEYHPRLVLEGGKSNLDAFGSGLAAWLDCEGFPEACAVVQLETPHRTANRSAIKPDLNLCFDASLDRESRALVIEHKQREDLKRSHVEEVGTSYLAGSSRAGGVVILNYDETGIVPKLPPKVVFLEGVRPDRQDRLTELRSTVLSMLTGAGLLPRRSPVVALLDVSSSMDDSYDSEAAQTGLRELLDTPYVRVLRFNDGIVQGGDLASDVAGLKTTGGTDLALALRQIEELFGIPRALLLISDGEYGTVPELGSFSKFRECRPEEIPTGVEWLRVIALGSKHRESDGEQG